MPRSHRVPPVAALFVAALAFASSPARADDARSAPDGPMAWVTLTIGPGRPTRLQVTAREPGDAAIAAALERVTGRTPETSAYAEGWVAWSTELPEPDRDRLTLRQPLALAPLLETLANAGQPNVTFLINHPRVGHVTLTGARVLDRQPEFTSAVASTAGPHEPIALEAGWRPADVARAVVLPLAALLAPIVAGLVLRRRSAARDRAPEAWFARAQSVQAIMMIGCLLWMVAGEATQVAGLADFATRGPRLGWMYVPLWIAGYLPTCFALAWIQRDMIRRLRGVDPMPQGGSFGLGTQIKSILPLLLLLAGVTAFADARPRVGVCALLAAIASQAFLSGGRGPLGMTPQALSSGALRDRVFEMAHRAGVRVRELYVVPLRRERMANAFAVSGGMVMVADDLLDRMSRREVDALLAHEISHLEHHHPFKALLASAAVTAVVATVMTTARIPFAPAVFVAAAWLTFLWCSRRFEFAADAGAAALTGDPEGVISGLGRLSRLNDAPLAWGRGMQWLVTHPTTERRGLAVARRAGLPPERARELLAHGLAGDDRYGAAERPGEESRVYSTAWKTAIMSRLSLAALAAAVAAPAAAVALARALGWEPPHAIAVLGGMVASAAAVLMAHDWMAARPVARLEAAVRRKLGDIDAGDVLFVALSPEDRARVYEGFLDWDLGLLSIEPDRLRYRGEQIALDLPRPAVRAIEVGAAMPSWIPAPRVIVRWMAPAGVAALTLRPATATRVGAIGPAARALAARLRTWHGAGEVESAVRGIARGATPPMLAAPEPPSQTATKSTPALAPPGTRPAQTAPGTPPAIGPVTSLRPAEAAAPRDLPLLAGMIGVLSAGASFLFGLGFTLGLEVFAGALLGMIAVRWPAMTSRERPADATHEPTSERLAA